MDDIQIAVYTFFEDRLAPAGRLFVRWLVYEFPKFGEPIGHVVRHAR